MKNRIKTIFNKAKIYTNSCEKKLEKLEKEFKYITPVSNNKKVLFSHSFSIYEPCFIHDKLMAYALSLRGFDIAAAFCDGIQDIECNVYGGVWGGGDNFKQNCTNCQKKSAALWSFIDEKNIHRYSAYLSANDFQHVLDTLNSIPAGEWINHHENGWDIGKWAKDILVNNYVVGDYKLIKDYERLGRNHLKNLLLSKIACERIIKTVQPDRIVSNDSYYGMWTMWELLAKEYNIPFYSHWSGTRVGGWCYAYNDASMKLDFSNSWEKYSAVSLTDTEKQRVEKWLGDRVGGKEMIVDTASLASYKNEDFDLTQININKPTALLSANVIWDLAALNKEVFTNNMSEWIIETINWFEQHSEYQLLIKAHPAELHPDIPETKETVKTILKKELPILPDNVFLLSPKVSISVYDLFPISKVGLVFTTSVGMEMAARGIPVVTAGKSHYRGYGFTLDPNTKAEYFKILENTLSSKIKVNTEQSIDLAMKFIKFNFFHYFSKTGLFEFEFGKKVKINISSLQDISHGGKTHFDYIVNCIENGEAILAENKWPGES